MCACEPESYPSDLTDAQWELIAPMVEPRPGGRPATRPRRRIVDAILYLNRTGCSWRQLPHDFPPWETVYWYFKTWTDDGVTDRIHDALRAAVRDAAGRDPMASAGIVDAQSVKGADTVGAHSRGYDAGKKVNGRKRHIVVDTLGLLIVVLVTAASLQDRDGGRRILDRARMAMPSIALVWAVLRSQTLPSLINRSTTCRGVRRSSAGCSNTFCSHTAVSCEAPASGIWRRRCNTPAPTSPDSAKRLASEPAAARSQDGC